MRERIGNNNMTQKNKTKYITPRDLSSKSKSVGRTPQAKVTIKAAKKLAPKRLDFEDRIFAGVHHKSGRVATIRQVIASDIPTRTGKELSLDERVRLATRRIRDNKRFVSMMMLGVEGVIDRKRALEEIKKRSHIGLHLLEIDRRHANLQTEQMLAEYLKGRADGGGNDGGN
jgi:hypothetical protein